ncbi:MAG: acetate--CoA ligase family protein [Azospirillaceae bacterium]
MDSTAQACPSGDIEDALAPLFRPRSIAIIGASSKPEKPGGRVLKALLRYGFAGEIIPVHLSEPEVQGLPAVASVEEIGRPVDLAIVSIPRREVLATLQSCAASGVRSAIVFSAGFAEAGEAGHAEQMKMAELARSSGMRILGPNCLGMMNLGVGTIATFSQSINLGLPAPGKISIVSQSGAFGTYCFIMARDRGLPVSYWVSTGNEADVDFADIVTFLASDPSTSVILGYLEGVRDGEKLVGALEAARQAQKPVILMKVGHTEVGAQAAASHTAALAGSDATYDAVLKQYGAYRARSIDELFDVGYACSTGRLPAGNRAGVVTVSGGAAVLMADAAEEYGLDLAPMPDASQRRLRDLVPFAAVRNPMDITGQIASDFSLYGTFIDEMLDHGRYDALITFESIVGLSEKRCELMLDAWRHSLSRYPDTPVYMSGKVTPEALEKFAQLGILIYEEPTRAVRAAAAASRIAAGFARPRRRPPQEKRGPDLPHGTMNEAQSLDWLDRIGVSTLRRRLVTSPQEAVDAAEALGLPVAIKVVSQDIAHKTDVGGVLLGLSSAEAVAAGFATLRENVSRFAPSARVEGVLVTPMAQAGLETIIGVHRDPVFGPMVMFGLGGVMAELLGDVTFRRAPIDRTEARAMIFDLRSAAIFRGFRGHPPADIAAIEDALVAVSEFAAAHSDSLVSLDINPFLVLGQGQGAVALDALLQAGDPI